MRYKKIVLLSLITLSLFGCSKESSTEIPNTESSTKHTEKESSSPISDSTLTSDTDKEASDSDTSSQTTSQWPESISELMNQYLDNRVVPYVDLKASSKKSYMTYWNREESTLYIQSNHEGISSSIIEEGKEVYETEGWDVVTTDSSMTATNEDKDLIVTLKVEDGLLSLIIKYDEPFNPDKTNQYPTELIQDMNSSIDNHGYDIPYIYLGTINLEGSASTAGYTISGGIFQDEIITLASDSITKANDSITNDDYKWAILSTTTSNIIARRKAKDGCTLKIEVYSEGGKNVTENQYAKMRITVKSPYTPSKTTEWPTDLQSFFTNTADGHSLPYFYLGTDSIWETSSSTFDIVYLADENTWDDSIIANAKKACTAEDKNVTGEQYKWKLTEGRSATDSTKTLTGTKYYADGCSLSFKLYNTGYLTEGDRAKLEIHYEPKYEVPEGADWSSDTKSKISQYFGSLALPYVYLGKLDEIANYNEITKTLEITGNPYFSAILTGAENAFLEAGWTGKIVTKTATQSGEEYTYKYFETEKTIDDDTKVKVTVDGTSHSIYYDGGTGGSCILKIELESTFNPPTGENASWDKYTYLTGTVADYIIENLQGHTIPFIYLNTDKLEPSFSIGEKKLYISGGKWNDSILSYAKGQLESDSAWNNVNVDEENRVVSATSTATDGCTMTLKVYKTVSEYVELSVEMNFAFVSVTSYSDKVNSSISTSLNGHSFPLIQLGSQYLSVIQNENSIVLSSYVFANNTLKDAKTVLDNDGYTTFYDSQWSDTVDETSYPYLIAFKEYDDGIVYLYLHNDSQSTTLEASFHTKPTSATKTEYTTEETAFLNQITDNHASLVPFLYMGDDSYTTSNTKLIGTSYDSYSIIKYYTKLVDLGYQDISLYISSYSMTFSATYIDTEGNEITIVIKKNQDLRGIYASLDVTYTPKASE